MNEPSPPFSKRNILAIIGADATIGTIVGWAANVIQILTYTNGLLIFVAIVIGSGLLLAAQYYTYQKSMISFLRNKLAQETSSKEAFQKRLERLVTEFRLRSAVNPRPFMVEAFVHTKKMQSAQVQVKALQIIAKIIEIDKGRAHGIVHGMSFALYVTGQTNCLETCQVDRIDDTRAWLTVTGNQLPNPVDPKQLILQPVLPPDLQEGEKQIGEILLIADGLM